MRGKEERGGPSPDHGVRQEHAGKVWVQGWELPRTPTSAPRRGLRWRWGETSLGLVITHVFFALKQKVNNNNNDKRQQWLKAEITRIPVQISLEWLKGLFGNKEEGVMLEVFLQQPTGRPVSPELTRPSWVPTAAESVKSETIPSTASLAKYETFPGNQWPVLVTQKPIVLTSFPEPPEIHSSFWT